MYQTKQKKALIDFFKNHTSKQLSVNEIISSMCPDGSGKSTIYRLISSMVEEGSLLRLRDEDGKGVLYQYTGEGTNCNEHFHLKCTSCGRLIHLDCEKLIDIANHISNEHNFSIDMKKTVLYGKCSECEKKEGKTK